MSSNDDQKVIIFSAPSGGGKTTIVHELMKRLNFPFAFSVSATTRPPRSCEKHGVDYYFLTVEEFKDKIINDEFVEWEEVYPGQFYGTLKSEVDRLWRERKIILFDVDVKGAVSLKRFFGNRSLSIFIKPPSLEVLRQRLINRHTETEQTLETRIAKALYELSFEPQFDVIIVNDDLENAIAKTIIEVKNFLLS
ncbi:MAG: guanylate kinase [Bacteroidales bacterium]|nr:guanylate kinase [Bacteroidales bacterium]